MSKNKSCGDYIHLALVSAISDKRFQDACKLIFYGLEARNKKGKTYESVNLFKTTEKGKNIFHLLAEKKMLSVSLLDMLYNNREYIWKRENRDPKNADDDLVNLLIAANNSSDTPIKTIISKSENPLELIERFNEGRHYIKFIISTNVECLTHAASATGKAKGWSVILNEKGYISQFVERLQVQNLELEEFVRNLELEKFGDQKVQFISYLGLPIVNALINSNILDGEQYSQAMNAIIAETEQKFLIKTDETDKAYSKIEPHKDESLVPTSNQEVVASTDVVDSQVNTYDNTDGKPEKKQNEQQQLTKDSGKIDIDSVDNQKFLETVSPVINNATNSYKKALKDKFLNIISKKIDNSDTKYSLFVAIYLDNIKNKNTSTTVLLDFLLQISKLNSWCYKDVDLLKEKFFQALVEKASFDDLSYIYNGKSLLKFAIKFGNAECANAIVIRLKKLGQLSEYQSLGHYSTEYVLRYKSAAILKCFFYKHPEMLPEGLVHDIEQSSLSNKGSIDFQEIFDHMNHYKECGESTMYTYCSYTATDETASSKAIIDGNDIPLTGVDL